MSHPGTITQLWSNGHDTVTRLANFDIGSAHIKPQHSSHLQSIVAPVLRSGGSVRLIGLASRTATNQFNLQLSNERANAVLACLRTAAGPTFAVASSVGQGEEAAAVAGIADGVEHPNWRAVIVRYWDRPVPPPPPERHIQSPVRLITRITQYNVPIPQRSTGTHDGQLGNMLGELAFQVLRPETGVWPSDTILVPENYTIHQIRITRKEQSTPSGMFGTAESSSYFSIRFHWGPPQQFALLWRGQNVLDRRLTNGQAMRIFQNPGAFAVGGMNIDRPSS